MPPQDSEKRRLLHLKKKEIRPHKIQYYLERRDPDFESKRNDVIGVYRAAEEAKITGDTSTVYVSYDAKPGIQAIGNVFDDRPPQVGKYSTIYRDYTYRRLGVVNLLAGMNLVTGEVTESVVYRNRSCEFIDFMKKLDERYADAKLICIVLDNHSTHTSAETRAYLDTVPGRFKFVFTPKHGIGLKLFRLSEALRLKKHQTRRPAYPGSTWWKCSSASSQGPC